jgi:DNA-binding NarL/FixJ family response regulator
MAESIRVLLADDHPLIRDGLRARLEAEADIVVVGEAVNGEEAQRQCRDLQPDVLVLDLNMPGPSPTETMAYVHERCPRVRVLVLTAFDDDAYVRGLIAAGVAGYVLKDEAPDALVDAVRSVAHGGAWFSRVVAARLAHPPAAPAYGPAFTDRERDLLRLLARGWDNARIAAELGLGEQTVRNYLSRLYGKLGVQTRAEAIVWMRDHGVSG